MKNIKRGLSKVKHEDKEKEYYNRRLEICKTCPLNTINGAQAKDIKVKAFLKAVDILKGLGDDDIINGSCTECGCSVDKKVSYADMECPQGKWGKEEEDLDFILNDGALSIITQSGVKEIKKIENHYELNLGDVKVNTSNTIKIAVKHSNYMLTEVQFSCSCMLTSDIIKRKDGYYDIVIKLSTDNKRIKEDETGCYLFYKNGKKVILIFKYNVVL